jgi:hypothetical protein
VKDDAADEAVTERIAQVAKSLFLVTAGRGCGLHVDTNDRPVESFDDRVDFDPVRSRKCASVVAAPRSVGEAIPDSRPRHESQILYRMIRSPAGG